MNDKPAVPASTEELATEIEKLLAGVYNDEVTYGVETEGYGKCVEAMWRAGYLATEYVASQLGVTGFQHGGAALRLLGALQGYEGPFMIIDGSQLLFPQYNIPERVQEFLSKDSIRTWLADEAQKKLDEDAERQYAHSNVRAHWRKLVQERPA